jgi:hypothetical protein
MFRVPPGSGPKATAGPIARVFPGYSAWTLAAW